MNNTIHISEIANLQLDELSHLPAEALMDLLQQVKTLASQLKENKSHLDKSLHLKYDDQISQLREQQDKPFGVMHFEDNTVDVAMDAKKQVNWDQDVLAKLFRRPKLRDYNPEEIIEVTYKVNEKKYEGLSNAVKKIIDKARSTRVNANYITLMPVKETQA
jgi:hypothetical protein